MNHAINNLHELLIEQLRELYNSEKLQLIALKEMYEKATAKELRFLIKEHLDDIAFQCQRLEQEFRKLAIFPLVEKADGIMILIEQCDKLLKRSADRYVRDVVLITMLQYMKHYEIAGYGSACSYANELGLISLGDKLHLSLEEKKAVDKRLSKIAFGNINESAKTTTK